MTVWGIEEQMGFLILNSSSTKRRVPGEDERLTKYMKTTSLTICFEKKRCFVHIQ